MRRIALALCIPFLGALAGAPAAAAAPAGCDETRADRSREPVVVLDPDAGPSDIRVFAMQFKQEARHVRTHETFRRKIECMVEQYVVPHLAPDRPNVVAFNEDIGLMTLATGTRGIAAREWVASPPGRACETQAAPCGAAGALGAANAGYAREVAYYRTKFPDQDPRRQVFTAATDTFVRGWMQTFADVARRYGVYILGSNNQAPSWHESRDPVDIAALCDPDLAPCESVYVADSPEVYNEVYMWGPDGEIVARNKKVPLTPLERDFLALSEGPASGPEAIENLRPYSIPGTNARIGFATSLPAFVYGPASVTDPCANVAVTYMRCLDALGTNVVMQDEANPGRWASRRAYWEPMTWMSSTWRAVGDPTVSFTWNVTPHMVGNLADIVFDGQTAITRRGRTGPGCHYVGNAVAEPGEPGAEYAGARPEFVAVVPWVRADGPREELRAMGDRLAPGSGDPLENDYLETAAVADLTFGEPGANPADGSHCPAE